MKAKPYIILFVAACFLTLTACHEPSDNSTINTDYTAKEGRCVVSIPNEYGLVYENENLEQDSMLDIDLIHAETVDGMPKKGELQYFSVLLNEPFRVMTPLSFIQKKNDEALTLTEWKLNGIGYQDKDSYLSKNMYTCIENTTIEPVYSDFNTVGMILFLLDEEQNPMHPIFDESGNIIDQENVKYFYGKYNFDPNKEAWTTNLNVDYFNVTAKKDENQEGKQNYNISIQFDLTEMVKKGKIAVKSLCKIENHGYMLHPSSATQIISGANMSMEGTFYIPLDEHTLQCTFTINM